LVPASRARRIAKNSRVVRFERRQINPLTLATDCTDGTDVMPSRYNRLGTSLPPPSGADILKITRRVMANGPTPLCGVGLLTTHPSTALLFSEIRVIRGWACAVNKYHHRILRDLCALRGEFPQNPWKLGHDRV